MNLFWICIGVMSVKMIGRVLAAVAAVAIIAASTHEARAPEIITDGKPLEMPRCAAVESYMAKAPPERRKAAVQDCLNDEAKRPLPNALSDPLGKPGFPPLSPWLSDEERRHIEMLGAIQTRERPLVAG